MLISQTLVFTTHGTIQNSHTKIIRFKYQFQYGMKNSSDGSHSNQIFKIVLNTS